MNDLTTDGTSKLGFARGLRPAAARVTDILTILSDSVVWSARHGGRGALAARS